MNIGGSKKYKCARNGRKTRGERGWRNATNSNERRNEGR